MKAAILLLVSFGSLFSVSARCEEGPPAASPVRIEGVKPYDRDFVEEVNRAIHAGTRWLRATQDPDGSWASRNGRAYPPGTVALGAHALLKGAVPPEDDSIRRAFARLRGQSISRTYDAAAVLMALEARYVATKKPTGSPAAQGRAASSSMHADDRVLLSTATDCLLRGQRPDGLWTYDASPGAADLSNSQYALLGLHAAARCGYEVPKRRWLWALKELARLQADAGPATDLLRSVLTGDERHVTTVPARARGFHYRRGEGKPTGSMTAAGVASSWLCGEHLRNSPLLTQALSRATEFATRDGLAWLQRHARFDGNPQEDGSAAARWHHYYLYAFERLGQLADMRFIGDHDWYLEGARTLLAEQDRGADGGLLGWGDFEGTCFALLFLERASTTSLPVVTGGR